MTSEKTIYLILDEVALMLYTFQSEDVFSVKINSFSEKFHNIMLIVYHEEIKKRE